MILTLLQSSIPVVLGPVGSVLLTALAVISALANAYQWRKSSQASHWEGTAKAYKEELVIVRERAERLASENKEMVAGISELRAKTDLSSLERQNLEADRRNQEVHERIVLSLNTLLDNNATRYAQITAVLSENTSAIQTLGDRMTKEFELHRIAFADMTKALQRKVDKRATEPS